MQNVESGGAGIAKIPLSVNVLSTLKYIKTKYLVVSRFRCIT